jgi:hypothetical protein
MDGGAGNDTFYVDNPVDRVIEAAGGGFDRLYTTASYALQTGQEVEFLRALDIAATEQLSLVGNSIGQTIGGNAGANAIEGGANAAGQRDLLYGGFVRCNKAVSHLPYKPWPWPIRARLVFSELTPVLALSLATIHRRARRSAEQPRTTTRGCSSQSRCDRDGGGAHLRGGAHFRLGSEPWWRHFA